MNDRSNFERSLAVQRAELAEFVMRIRSVKWTMEGVLLASPEGDCVIVSKEFMSDHCPCSGSFYVRRKDGYETCIPRVAFERGLR